MKSFILFSAALFSAAVLQAQTPDEALRQSWYVPNTSARTTAVGGVMGSLGGDISASSINPAGLGFYRYGEIVLTPGLLRNNNQFNYRGKDTTGQKNAFQYGPSGIIFAHPRGNGSRGIRSEAWSISVNQLASFNNHIRYQGINNQSSYSEQFLEELTRDRADTNAALSNYIFGSSLAFRTYLIDKKLGANGQQTGYTGLPTISSGLQQQYDSRTRGGIHDINVGYGVDLNSKWLLGASLSVPISSFRRDLSFVETDISGNKNNDFNYSRYTEEFRSNGVGLGAKFGAIYRPATFIRLGLALHTPTVMYMNDRIRATMTTDTEGYAGVNTETSDNLNSGNAGERSYLQTTPWKAIASASYVFRETANTKRQRAFISADIEYVDYASMGFSAVDEAGEIIPGYYSDLNEATNNLYRGTFNYKVGGEIKFDPWMIRAGASYYSNPYRNEVVQADRTVLSGGLGWRNKGMFIDLTYAHQIQNDVSFPYLLNDVANTNAALRANRGMAQVTLGFKL